MLSVRNMHARILPYTLLFPILLSAVPGRAWAGQQDGTLTLPGQSLTEDPIAGRLPHRSYFRSNPSMFRRLDIRADITGAGSRE